MPLYKIKINHKVTDDKGAEKFVNDAFVVEATSVIDAQAKLLESGDFDDCSVEAVTKPRISHVIPSDDGDKYYRVRMTLCSNDDERYVVFLLVCARDFDAAVSMAKIYAGSTMHEIEFVQLTPIVGFVG